MNIILLGAPGSGKGTQAEKLVERMHLTQFSTGDIFRRNISENTPLGVEAAKYMNEGKLVPDAITNAMVENALQAKHDGFIFDGYPRTIEQADALGIMLVKLGSTIDHVIYIDVDKQILLNRIAGRVVCPKCKRSYHITSRPPKTTGICDYDQVKLERRPDDEPSKVQVRLDAYESQTAPLIDYYKNIETLIHVDAQEMDGESVYKIIQKAISE
ncbi:adenylate kinase [Williamsoniiplasma somnilux]|uniref:Adenylate kinase n=1 Tax=Williamsoniiplasma somnilux TaxID=215578 RepID=A0A2K8NZ97_9MOLU|nr:adenylate kinase [Williamsoniiplasma somnilux]ATZ18538.1 adenylate kinase [Williamsoniiplasma somnilux]